MAMRHVSIAGSTRPSQFLISSTLMSWLLIRISFYMREVLLSQAASSAYEQWGKRTLKRQFIIKCCWMEQLSILSTDGPKLMSQYRAEKLPFCGYELR